MARPSKNNPTGAQTCPRRTPEVVVCLKHALGIGASIETACKYAKIATTTYYTWMSQDKKLQAELAALRANPILKALDTVYRSLDDAQTAKWLLERREKGFSPQSNVDLSSSDGTMTPVTKIEIVAGKDDD